MEKLFMGFQSFGRLGNFLDDARKIFEHFVLDSEVRSIDALICCPL
jgi:hypothetical protein